MGPGGGSLTAYTIFDALRSGFDRVVIVTRPALREPLEVHLEAQLGPDLPLDWAYQATSDLPDAHRSKAAGRTRPWGTGQAVLACRDLLTGAFGIANVDDWYGPEALRALADALRSLPPGPPCPGILVGFPMAATLPPGGAGVSRGWIRSRGGSVERVLELTETARAGGSIVGTDPEGTRVRVPEQARASMNLWGFGACALPLLSSAFSEFLARSGEDPEAEFALSSAVDTLLSDRSLALGLLPEGSRWFGITHPGDAPWVRERLRHLHADGTYPDHLPSALRDVLSRLAP